MALPAEDRLFPGEGKTRDIVRALHGTARSLPIVSPHGYTDPRRFARNAAFPDPGGLFDLGMWLSAETADLHYARISVGRAMRTTWPFYGAAVFPLLLLTCVLATSPWLPSLFD